MNDKPIDANGRIHPEFLTVLCDLYDATPESFLVPLSRQVESVPVHQTVGDATLLLIAMVRARGLHVELYSVELGWVCRLRESAVSDVAPQIVVGRGRTEYLALIETIALAHQRKMLRV